MTITLTDPYAVLAFGAGLALSGLGAYLLACTIGLALAIKAGHNAE